MVKRFCDLCKNEIKGSYFEIAICEVEKPFLYKKGDAEFFDICDNCRTKIFKRNKKESH